MHIKSAMLLPKAETEDGEVETAVNPRSELIRQLLEYKKFKDAANLLDAAADEAQSRFSRPATIIEKLQPDAEPEVDIEQVSVWNLLEAFDAICKATGGVFNLNHITDETPIDLYQIEILARLQSEGALSFSQIFEGKPSRIVMVGLFLAMLELIRHGLISIESLAKANTYRVAALTDEPPAEAVRKIIASTNQIQEKPKEDSVPSVSSPQADLTSSTIPEEAGLPQADSAGSPQTGQSAVGGLIEPACGGPAVRSQPPIPIVELPAEHKPERTAYDNTEHSIGDSTQASN